VSIATSLESGELSLDEFSCKEGAQNTKSQYMAAEAVGLYIGADLKKAALGEDEIDKNDHVVLYSALGLHNLTGHPPSNVLKVRDLYLCQYHTFTYMEHRQLRVQFKGVGQYNAS
jgi:hypothetical protein